MPANPESLWLTDAYGGQLRQVRDMVLRIVRDGWRRVDPSDLDRSFTSWLDAALEFVTWGQSEAVTISDAYLAGYLSSELGEAVPPKGIDPERYAGHTRDGRPLRDVLTLPLMATKAAIAESQPIATALSIGLDRATRAAGTEVMEASRSSLTAAMDADERVTGYRRVVHSRRPCGACLGLAGQHRHTDQGLAIHARCSCTAEPIVAGVRERATRPDGKAIFEAMTPAQQDGLFASRGGADKADLIRSGRATLSDLVSTKESPEWGLQIFETPLAALAS